MKTIAVTGATGFVGSTLVRTLRSAGYSVIAYGRTRQDGVTFWDISKGVLGDAPQVDVVVHCAAEVDDWATEEKTRRVNVTGTANVLHTFNHAPRFIYLSSASVYDTFSSSSVFTEKSLCGSFLNAYSKTKWEGEILVEKSLQKNRVILRPHIIYGTGDKTVLPRLLKARKWNRFILIGNGKNHVSVTHIDNLVSSILLALEAPMPSPYEIFNIADSQDATAEDLLCALKTALSIDEPILHIPRLPAYIIGACLEVLFRKIGSSRPPLLTRYAVAQMAYEHALDISKAQQILGYLPQKNYKHDFADLTV